MFAKGVHAVVLDTIVTIVIVTSVKVKPSAYVYVFQKWLFSGGKVNYLLYGLSLLCDFSLSDRAQF